MFLSRLLSKKEKQGNLYGIKVAQNALMVSYLIYVDDLLIMCHTDPHEPIVVNECFNKYCSWSGQQANAEKSNMLLSSSIT